MSIRPKSKVLENICFTHTKVGAKRYPHYCATIGTQGRRRVRIHAASLAECKKRVEDWYAARAKSGDGIAALSMKELADATLAFAKMKESGCAKTLYEIVCDHLHRYGAGLNRTRMTDAYDLYFARMSDAQTSSKQIVRNRVGNFVAKLGDKYVDEITHDMVKRYLAGLGDVAPKTWNNNMTYIKSFFAWCAKKTNGFCVENPLFDMEKMPEKAKIPECAKVDGVRELMAHAYANASPHRDLILLRLVLNYFSGMRMAEAKRLKTEDIRIADGSILVREPKGSQTSRTASYRTFRIEDCGGALAAWLKVVDMKKAAACDMADSTFENAVGKLRKACTARPPKNAGRHSFISYHVAAFGNPQKTEGIVGTSEDMRKNNYQTLMTKADGEAYFAITPQAVCGTIKEKEESK